MSRNAPTFTPTLAYTLNDSGVSKEGTGVGIFINALTHQSPANRPLLALGVGRESINIYLHTHALIRNAHTHAHPQDIENALPAYTLKGNR